MKKIFLSAFALFLAGGLFAQNKESGVKDELSMAKKEEANIRKEKREEKKELRKLEGNEVSYQNIQAFHRDFGFPTILKMQRFPDYDRISFRKPDHLIYNAYYNSESQLIGTSMMKTFADLPANAQVTINSKYGDYKKGAVLFFDDNEENDADMFLYDTRFEGADNYFMELKKGDRKIALIINPSGDVSYFADVRN